MHNFLKSAVIYIQRRPLFQRHSEHLKQEAQEELKIKTEAINNFNDLTSNATYKIEKCLE